MCDPISATLAVVGLVGQQTAVKKEKKLLRKAEEKKSRISREAAAGIGGIQLPQRPERRSILGEGSGRSTILTGPGGVTGKASRAERTLIGGA